MATVTAFTADRSAAIEAQAVVGAEVVGDNLVMSRFNTQTFVAGNVRGPTGSPGVTLTEYNNGLDQLETDLLAAIASAHSAAGSIGTTQLADLAVTNAKIADLAVTNAKIANNTILGAKINNISGTLGQSIHYFRQGSMVSVWTSADSAGGFGITLPVGCRPTTTVSVPVVNFSALGTAEDALGVVNILQTGEISIAGPIGQGRFSVSFKAA